MKDQENLSIVELTVPILTEFPKLYTNNLSHQKYTAKKKKVPKRKNKKKHKKY